jgi:hypothetical protein
MLLLSLLFVIFVVADDSHTTRFVPPKFQFLLNSHGLPCINSDTVGIDYGDCSTPSHCQWLSNGCSDKRASFTTTQIVENTNSFIFQSFELSSASFGSNENLYFSDPLTYCDDSIDLGFVCGNLNPHDLVLKDYVHVRDFFYNMMDNSCFCPGGSCMIQFLLVNECDFGVGVQVVSPVIGSPVDYNLSWYKLPPKECSASGTDLPPNVLFLDTFSYCEISFYTKPSISAVIPL